MLDRHYRKKQKAEMMVQTKETVGSMETQMDHQMEIQMALGSEKN